MLIETAFFLSKFESYVVEEGVRRSTRARAAVSQARSNTPDYSGKSGLDVEGRSVGRAGNELLRVGARAKNRCYCLLAPNGSAPTGGKRVQYVRPLARS